MESGRGEAGGRGLGVVSADSVEGSTMSDVATGNIFRKLRYTPAKDLVRGRISGRLDVKGTIAASGLPAGAKDLVRRIVKRTRLWLSEQVEVADDLIAHFADAIPSRTAV